GAEQRFALTWSSGVVSWLVAPVCCPGPADGVLPTGEQAPYRSVLASPPHIRSGALAQLLIWLLESIAAPPTVTTHSAYWLFEVISTLADTVPASTPGSIGQPVHALRTWARAVLTTPEQSKALSGQSQLQYFLPGAMSSQLHQHWLVSATTSSW